MATRKIVAIGGGQIYVPCQPPETLKIDRESVHLAAQQLPVGRETVRVLFIPTASKDDMGYCHGIYNLFEVRLGCKVDYLRLLAEPKVDAKAKIESADLIYVGGGDTATMMKVWRQYEVDTLLRTAHDRGIVLTGMSAGSICWFNGGWSDSEKVQGKVDWKPVFVSGLGFLNFDHSPHFDSESWRRDTLQSNDLLKPVIALEDNCAMEIVGGTYRVLASQPDKTAHLCYRIAGKYYEVPITQSEEFERLSELIEW